MFLPSPIGCQDCLGVCQALNRKCKLKWHPHSWCTWCKHKTVTTTAIFTSLFGPWGLSQSAGLAVLLYRIKSETPLSIWHSGVILINLVAARIQVTERKSPGNSCSQCTIVCCIVVNGSCWWLFLLSRLCHLLSGTWIPITDDCTHLEKFKLSTFHC